MTIYLIYHATSSFDWKSPPKVMAAFSSKEVAEVKLAVLNDEDKRLGDAMHEYSTRLWVHNGTQFVHGTDSTLTGDTLDEVEGRLTEKLRVKYKLPKPYKECRFQRAFIEEVELVGEVRPLKEVEVFE